MKIEKILSEIKEKGSATVNLSKLSVEEAITVVNILKNSQLLTSIQLKIKKAVDDQARHHQKLTILFGFTLSQTMFLEKLILNSCRLRDEDIRILTNYLRTNFSLKEINLDNNYLSILSITYFVDVFQYNVTLCMLSLGCNRFAHESAILLADVLKLNRSLKHLSLRGNKIEILGIRAFADVLLQNSTLTSLDLFDCADKEIDYCASLLLEALYINASIRRLDFWYKGVSINIINQEIQLQLQLNNKFYGIAILACKLLNQLRTINGCVDYRELVFDIQFKILVYLNEGELLKMQQLMAINQYSRNKPILGETRNSFLGKMLCEPPFFKKKPSEKENFMQIIQSSFCPF